MTALAETIPQAVGDWDVRARDLDAVLIGRITDRLVDADRAVRTKHGYHGMPMWSIHRLANAREEIHRPVVRYCIMGSVYTYIHGGGVRSDRISPELVFTIARDVERTFVPKMDEKPALRPPLAELAEFAGVSRPTYGRVRRVLLTMFRMSLELYVSRLRTAWLEGVHRY